MCSGKTRPISLVVGRPASSGPSPLGRAPGLHWRPKGSTPLIGDRHTGSVEPGHRTCVQVGETFVLAMSSWPGRGLYTFGPARKVTVHIAIIDSGLQANEQVVIAGQSRLQPGSPVTALHGQAAQTLLNQSAQQTVIP